MKTLISMLLISLALLSTTSEASSLTLTCSFKITNETQLSEMAPAGCANPAHQSRAKRGRWTIFRFEDLMTAEPPQCPQGFVDLGIAQGGVVAHNDYGLRASKNKIETYFEKRRICLKAPLPDPENDNKKDDE